MTAGRRPEARVRCAVGLIAGLALGLTLAACGGGGERRPPMSTSSPRSTSRCLPPPTAAPRRRRSPGGHPGADRGQHGGGPGGRDRQRLHRGSGPVPLRPRLGGGPIDHRRATWPHGSTWRPPDSRRSSPGSTARERRSPCRWASGRSKGSTSAPQQLTSATLPQIGGKGEPVGLLGSDVLARFGAVRIDFAAGDLVLPGPQGPPLTSDTSLHRADRAGSRRRS